MKTFTFLISIGFFIVNSTLMSFTAKADTPPYLSPISDQVAVIDEIFTYDVNAIDAVPAETYELLEARPGMTIDPSTGLITWTPTSMSDGGKVTVRAYNTAGESVQSFDVYISRVACDASLISYWKMDNNVGSTLQDVANNHDATFKGAGTAEPEPTVSTDAMVGNSILFSPASAFDSVYAVSDEAPYAVKDDSAFSVSFWFKNEPAGFYNPYETFIGRFSDNNSYWAVRWNPSNDTIEFKIQDSGTDDTLVTTAAVTDNNWHHVVATFSGDVGTNKSQLRIYLDKVQTTKYYDFYTDNYTGNGKLSIGCWYIPGGYTYPFSGYMDEVAYYNKALSPSEVTDLYNKGINHQYICSTANTAPIITSTPVTSVNEDAAYSYTVTANDLDSGDPMTLYALKKPSWLSFNASSGLLSGTPTNSNVGDTTVVLAAYDGKDTVKQSYTLTVVNVNDAPVLSGIESSAIAYTEGDAATAITSTITVSDVDNANMQSATVSITGNYTSAEDMLQFTNMGNITGSFSTSTGILTLSGSDTKANYQTALRSVKYLNSNNDNPSNLTRTISIKVNDGALNSNTATRNITVTKVNDAPVIDSQNPVSTDEDVSFDVTLSDLNVTDVDNTYPTDFTITVKNGPNYSHSGNTVTPALNWNGTLKVAFDLSDGTNTVSDSLDVTVNAVNDPPEFTSTPITDAYADQYYLYAFTVTDPDAGDVLTYTAVKKPTWATFNYNSQLNHYILTGTPDYTNIGSDSVVISVFDGTLTSYQRFLLTVNSQNHVPQFTSTPVTSVNEDVEYTYNVTVSDADASDVLTVTADTLPSWLTFNAGTLVVSGTPTNDQVGMKADSTYRVALKVSDGKQSSTQGFNVTVNNVNDPPVIESQITSVTTYADSSFTINLSDVQFSDVDNPTSGLTLIIVNGNGYVVSGNTVTINPGISGELVIAIKISDGASYSNTFNFAVTVDVANAVPQISTNNLVGKIYPIPASNQLNFQLNSKGNLTVQILDVTGKLVLQKKFENYGSTLSLDVSNLTNGMYFYKFMTDTSYQVGKILIKK